MSSYHEHTEDRRNRKLIHSALENENYLECIDKLEEELKEQEIYLEKYISGCYKDIVAKCSKLSDFNVKPFEISDITQHYTDYLIKLNMRSIQETEIESSLEKINNIFVELKNLSEILKNCLAIPNRLTEYYHIAKNLNKSIIDVKKYKRYSFYSDIKTLVQNRKLNLLDQINKEADSWLCNILLRLENLGKLYVKTGIVEKSELNLPVVYVSHYIHTMLEQEEEFFKTFNKKRKDGSKNLNYFEFIGFLFLEKALFLKNENFTFKIKNNNFSKEELIKIISVMRNNQINSQFQEESLEKICCDYILEKREHVKDVNSLEDFIENCTDFLKGVEQPLVIEIFCKNMDDFYIEFFDLFDPLELQDKLNKLQNIKKEYSFVSKTTERLKEKEKEYEKIIDKIFENKNYSELREAKIIYTDSLIIYLKEKFIEEYKNTHKLEKKFFEGETVKMYVFLKTIGNEKAAIFQPAVLKNK